MKLLVDTQILIWVSSEPERAPAAALGLLARSDTTLHFSVISIWEVAIKASLGRRSFSVDPTNLRNALLGAGWTEVPLESRHAIGVRSLPQLHRDPFDRVLIAQSQVDNLLLLTADRQIAAYSASVLFVG